MLSVQNQQPIETLRANGPHKSFGHAIGLRNTKRRLNRLDAFASKYLFETLGEFLIAVANEEAEGLGVLRQRPRQLPGPAGLPTGFKPFGLVYISKEINV